MENLEQFASTELQKWVDALSLNGTKYDRKKILEILNKRTFEGKPVTSYLVDGPQAALNLYKSLGISHADEIINYIWDYYGMAFWETGYKCLPGAEQTDEFFNQSFFEAFQAGLGFILNFDSVIIGVLLPVVHFDAQKRLHNGSYEWVDCPCFDRATDMFKSNEYCFSCKGEGKIKTGGPAVEWPDGTKFYWWHGVEIPAEFIETPTKVDFLKIIKSDNQEIKRVMCEIFGWEKVTETLRHKVIQQDDYGTLVQTEGLNDGDPTARFIRVVCPSTGRKYFLRVAPNTKTAREGVASTFAETEDTYKPELET